MPLIKLLSHARAPSQYNTATITFNAGKPETVVEADCFGLRERQMNERVHYRDEEENERCSHCGAVTGGFAPWMSNQDRWLAHPRCCAKG